MDRGQMISRLTLVADCVSQTLEVQKSFPSSIGISKIILVISRLSSDDGQLSILF